jgi:hypothetical protein
MRILCECCMRRCVGYQGMPLHSGSFLPDGVIDGISDDGHQLVGSLHDAVLTGLAVRWTCQ